MLPIRTLLFLAASLTACGGMDPSSGSAPPGGDDDPDRAAAEAELGRIQEALGEATCGSTPPDAVLDPSSLQGVSSVDGNYDHPTCRNAFVVDVPGAIAGRQFTGGTLLRWPDPFTCLLYWGYLSLWQKQQDGSYVKVSESSSLGFWYGLSQVGYVCSARGTVQVPADGDYKLVGATGVLFGPFLTMSIY